MSVRSDTADAGRSQNDGVTTWPDVLDAIGAALSGDTERGRNLLVTCWDSTTEGDYAQRCVIAHYLADLQADLDDEVAWDERALDAFESVADTDLVPVGIPSARGMAPSLHLNIGDGYRRQGRLAEARQHLEAGLAGVDALGDDEYGALIRTGLGRLEERLIATSMNH